MIRLKLRKYIWFTLLFHSTLYAQSFDFTETGNSIVGYPQTNDITESLAWGDYDNDGDEDLYLTIVGDNILFENDGTGVFTDVSNIAGVDHSGWSVGSGFADLDNDGDLDLYVVTFTPGNDVLYRNDGPIGQDNAYVFTDISQSAGINDTNSSRGMSFIDFNQDGLLDIYVNAIGDDILYENQGGLQFIDVAFSAGIVNPGQGVGVVVTDVNNDGLPDLFTGNRSSDLNELFINSGSGFVSETVNSGIDVVGLGMGVLSFDYDNDLDMDLYWTTWPGEEKTPVSNALYQNQGTGLDYVDVAVTTGTVDSSGWGISTNAGDLDLDGYQDFIVTNGFSVGSTANVVFHNQGGLTFNSINSEFGNMVFDGRGVAMADIDGDGDLDISLTAGSGSPNKLWRNDSDLSSHHWLGLKLVGTMSNRSAIGARVIVHTTNKSFVQEVSGGAGRGSFNSLPLEFGLGAESVITHLDIRWPNGLRQLLSANITVDQYHILIEPEDLIFSNGFE